MITQDSILWNDGKASQRVWWTEGKTAKWQSEGLPWHPWLLIIMWKQLNSEISGQIKNFFSQKDLEKIERWKYFLVVVLIKSHSNLNNFGWNRVLKLMFPYKVSSLIISPLITFVENIFQRHFFNIWPNWKKWA